MSDARRLSRLGFAAVTAISMLAALSPSVAAGGSGSTRWVDDDGHAGPKNCGGSGSAYKRVQNAVNASHQNDTIMVCPGTYRGDVVVGPDKDGLTIRGTDPWKATLMPPLQEINTAREATVLVTIDEATDVTVRGLRLSMQNEANCTPVDMAVFVHGARRAQIRGNQIFASADSQDCGYRTGIYVTSKTPQTAGLGTIPATGVLIAHNLVTNFASVGIQASGDANVEAQITDNSLHYYRTFQPTAAAVAPSGRLGPAGFQSAGIEVTEQASAIVSFNVIQSAPDAPQPAAGPGLPEILSVGIATFEAEGIVTIRHNLIRRVSTGMYMQSIGIRINRNTVRKASVGLDIGFGGGSNSVVGNELYGAVDGIHVYQTGDNVFRDNTASADSGNYACDDETTGSGTAGTANTWTNNTGALDYPDGICDPAP